MPSYWDRLPLELQHRIYAHALARRLLHEPSLAKFELKQMLTRHPGQQLRLPPHPASLAKAMRLLATHLHCVYEEPGDDSGPQRFYRSAPNHATCRLMRHDEWHMLRTRQRNRFARTSRRVKHETRALTLEALDLCAEPHELTNASDRALEAFGIAPPASVGK